MINTIEIHGHPAVVSLDPDLGMFRGEFIGLNGGADFYAESMSALIHEGERSLATFLQVCKENGVEPSRRFSGKFQVRLPSALHAQAALVAAARGMSLNQFVAEAIEHETEAAD